MNCEEGSGKEPLFGSFPVPPFSFFWNSLYEIQIKTLFFVLNCIKTCQREEVNKLSPKQIVMWEVFEHFYYLFILRGGGGVENSKRAQFLALFQFPFFGFFWISLCESLIKINFYVINCIKTCQREQVNNFLQHFSHAKCRVNNFWTTYNFTFTRGWKTG